jgi:hypothetical protein
MWPPARARTPSRRWGREQVVLGWLEISEPLGEHRERLVQWCLDHDLLAATRAHIELHVRWLEEVRRFKPSTVSRRMSVWPASIEPASSTTSLISHRPRISHRPSMCADRTASRVSDVGLDAPAGRDAADRGPGVTQSVRLRPRCDAGAARAADLRGNLQQHRRPRRGARHRVLRCTARATWLYWYHRRRLDGRSTRQSDTTGPARTSTGTPITSSPPTWHPARDGALPTMPN